MILSYIIEILASVMFGGAIFCLSYWFFSRRELLKEKRKEERLEELSYGDRMIKIVSKWLYPISSRLLSEKKYNEYKMKIKILGDPPITPLDIVSMQIVWAIFFGLLVFIFIKAIHGSTLSYLWVIVGVGFGAIFPLIRIKEAIRKRHIKIQKALPFCLDLLTLSVEAGLDFGAALSKVVEKSPEGPLKEEFSIMLKEIKMGKTREEAFRNLADRVQLPSLTQFISNIIQAERMGVSIGKVLRIQSTQLRIERMQRAEKLANEAPVKLLFPLIFCIFPTVFIILFAPIFYQFIQG